jgi:polysaccharide export outer membrane protein
MTVSCRSRNTASSAALISGNHMMHSSNVRYGLTLALACVAMVGAGAQQRSSVPSAPSGANDTKAAADPSALPPGYVIGADDILSIVFWKDNDMSATVVVRPDGKISLPLVNEVQAAGRTPEQLRAALVEAAGKYIEDPNATVVVKEIHSRNAFITGNVTKPGAYPVASDMNVLQLIALAGGLLEYSDAKNIVVIRVENGRRQYHKVNYKDVVNQKHAEQNIALKPGDTVVVP